MGLISIGLLQQRHWKSIRAHYDNFSSFNSSPMFLVGGHLRPFLNLINRIILSHLISKGYTCCFSTGPRPAKLCFRCKNLGIENQRHSLDLCPQNCASCGELCKNAGHCRQILKRKKSEEKIEEWKKRREDRQIKKKQHPDFLRKTLFSCTKPSEKVEHLT